jgi:hypothetical protein
MATLKEALGELYTPDIENKLKNTNFVDLKDGEYISKEKHEALLHKAQADEQAIYKADADEWKKSKAEFDRLKQFEADTKTAEQKAKVHEAFKAMLTKNKVRAGVAKRESAHLNTADVKLDDKGEITKEWEKAYIDSLKADDPDCFEVVNDLGAPNTATVKSGGNNNVKQDLADILRERRN